MPSWISAKSFVFAVLRAQCSVLVVFSSTLLTLWLLLFLIYSLLPNMVIERFSPAIAEVTFELFNQFDRLRPGQDSLSHGKFAAFTDSPWFANCYPERTPPDPFAEEDTSEEVVAKPEKQPTVDTLGRLLTGIVDQRQQLAMRNFLDQVELREMRNHTRLIAGILIVLGMATTIVSALNSSEFGNGSTRSAAAIKITAIVLPAVATMITAFGTLFASTEQTSRKAEMVYNVAALSAEIDGTMIAAPCPIVVPADIRRYEVLLVGWNRRFTEIVASAEYGKEYPKAEAGNSSSPPQQPPATVDVPPVTGAVN